MKIPTMIIAALLLSSCSTKDENDRPMLTQNIAAATRSSWDHSAKPIALKITNAPNWISRVGVCITPADATETESEALDNGVYERFDGIFVPEDKHAMTSDTAAALAVYYPIYIGADNRISEKSAPFGEHLYATEKTRRTDSIIQKKYVFESQVELHSAMAVLEIGVESDDLRDRLQSIEISGPGLPVKGTYDHHTGEWTDVHYGGEYTATTPDCLLNNGATHTIHLIPLMDETILFITLRVNGKEYPVKTHLSPMSPGSLIRLNLTKKSDKIKITGSWIAQKRPLSIRGYQKKEEINVGEYLRIDGTYCERIDSLTYAVVIESDGQHGKAVALYDSETELRFGTTNLTTEEYYATIDGLHTQGVINPKKSDNIPPGLCIVHTSSSKDKEGSAFAHREGAWATSRLLNQYKDTHKGEGEKGDVLREVMKRPGAYIPSFGELANLYLSFYPTDDVEPLKLLDPPTGIYLTSTESDSDHIYTFDFGQGSVNGQSPKAYTRAKVRYFYLF